VGEIIEQNVSLLLEILIQRIHDEKNLGVLGNHGAERVKILVYGWSGTWFAVGVIQSLDDIGHSFNKYELAPEAGQEF
jgi:hypothetical protein